MQNLGEVQTNTNRIDFLKFKSTTHLEGSQKEGGEKNFSQPFFIKLFPLKRTIDWIHQKVTTQLEKSLEKN